MPFVKIPMETDSSNEHVEGGIILMLAWDVPEIWGLAEQVKFDAVYDDEGDYDVGIAHKGVLGFDVVGPLGAYIEYLGIVSTEGDSDYQAFFSCGLTYPLNEDLVIDAGTQVGLNNAADDIQVFVGMT